MAKKAVADALKENTKEESIWLRGEVTVVTTTTIIMIMMMIIIFIIIIINDDNKKHHYPAVSSDKRHQICHIMCIH